METVITFTPAQLVAFIGTIGGLVSAIGLIVTYAVKVTKKLKEPMETMRREIASLKEKNKEQDDKIADLNNRLGAGDKRFDKIEESTIVILETLRALLEHSLGGGESELLKAKSNLDTYLSSSLFGNKQE